MNQCIKTIFIVLLCFIESVNAGLSNGDLLRSCIALKEASEGGQPLTPEPGYCLSYIQGGVDMYYTNQDLMQNNKLEYICLRDANYKHLADSLVKYLRGSDELESPASASLFLALAEYHSCH